MLLLDRPRAELPGAGGAGPVRRSPSAVTRCAAVGLPISERERLFGKDADQAVLPLTHLAARGGTGWSCRRARPPGAVPCAISLSRMPGGQWMCRLTPSSGSHHKKIASSADKTPLSRPTVM